jgi:hypothetical protein
MSQLSDCKRTGTGMACHGTSRFGDNDKFVRRRVRTHVVLSAHVCPFPIRKLWHNIIPMVSIRTYNVMSQLSDWKRAHMCTENHVCFGRIHGSQLREGANAGQHTPYVRTYQMVPWYHGMYKYLTLPLVPCYLKNDWKYKRSGATGKLPWYHMVPRYVFQSESCDITLQSTYTCTYVRTYTYTMV